MFWIPEKLRSVGLKFYRQRRNLSFGLLFPGHMLSFWIKPGYLHYPLQPWAPEEGGRHCLLFESVEAARSYESSATLCCINWICDKQNKFTFSNYMACCSGLLPSYRYVLHPLYRQPR